MSTQNGECPYAGACKCEDEGCPCKTARRREGHCGRHARGCHLECRRKRKPGKESA